MLDDVRAIGTLRGSGSGAILSFLKLIAAGCALCLFLGLGVVSSVPMPGYAVVMLDDAAKTFIAPFCLAEWQRRPSDTVGFLRRGTAGEAYGLRYKPDEACRQSGAFVDDDRSLTGHLFVKLGILGPAQHWWDAPYQTEAGVVYPERPTP